MGHWWRYEVTLPIVDDSNLAVHLVCNVRISCCILNVARVKWGLRPKIVLLLGESCLHLSVVILLDHGDCHISHSSLVTVKPENALEINVAGRWYLKTPGASHLDLVIRYINASKMYAAAKKIHEYWTLLVTTATTK
jgi:hypothetical protein